MESFLAIRFVLEKSIFATLTNTGFLFPKSRTASLKNTSCPFVAKIWDELKDEEIMPYHSFTISIFYENLGEK